MAAPAARRSRWLRCERAGGRIATVAVGTPGGGRKTVVASSSGAAEDASQEEGDTPATDKKQENTSEKGIF